MIFVVSQFLFSRETSFELLGDLLLLIYIFILALLPDKVNDDNSFTISDYKEEQLLLSTSTNYSDKSEARLHYILHLINPMQPLKAKITFAITAFNEIFPEKTVAFFKSSGNNATFIAATRTNADNQVLSITEYDDTVLEIQSRIDSILTTFETSKQYIFSRPMAIKQTENFESGFLIPVHFLGYLEGVLAVTGKVEDKGEHAKIRLAESFAEGLAIIIQNDRLYSIPQAIADKKAQTETSANFVNEELPKEAPLINNWEVSQRVVKTDEYIGDFSDYINLPNGDTMIIYGRSCTTGTRAAIFYVKLKAMIRCFASQQLSPAQMLNKLSFSLNFDSSCDTFATVAAITLSQRNKEAIISLAGAPIPLITRVRNGFVETVNIDSGIPLGLFNQGMEPYKDSSLQFMPGDGILLYTEGITSYLNKKNELMDTENLKLALEQVPEQQPEVMLSSLAAMLKPNKATKINKGEDYLMILAKTE